MTSTATIERYQWKSVQPQDILDGLVHDATGMTFDKEYVDKIDRFSKEENEGPMICKKFRITITVEEMK
jgi:hypothetical protein